MTTEDNRSRTEKILGHAVGDMQHNYPDGLTLRQGIRNLILALMQAQSFIAIQALQGDDEGVRKAGTMIQSYEALRVDLQALLDHTELARHESRDQLIAEIREGWPKHGTGRTHGPSGRILDIPPVRDGGATAQLIEFAVDHVLGGGHE